MKNVQKNSPAIILLIVLVGFPQISETIFTPSLPEISRDFHVTAQTAQLLMGSYFMAFAVGVLVWGQLSDRWGRRPTMLLGILVYLIGNIGLFSAPEFGWLLLARLVQAFGASVGSVVTQTIMRESFSGVKGAQVFAKVGGAMALAPALGPFIGGIIQQYFGFKSVCSVLIGMAIMILIYSYGKLPETMEPKATEQSVSIWRAAKILAQDKRVWAYAVLIAGINGILFSFYAEAPFVLMQMYGMDAMHYGIAGMVIALSSIVGAMCANYAVKYLTSYRIIMLSLLVSGLGVGIGCLSATMHSSLLFLVAFFIVFTGLNTILPLVLNDALVGYENIIGTASGVFGFAYYVMISLMTYGMSLMHNGTAFALPLYVGSLIVLMLVLTVTCLRKR
ncbi:multidrug effflux MFS transporter [Weissella viridescens]|uniref:multidrug effflux MFS transporter n=1 Tax=Weissella viridescens TaxID=1629 RepID=UPI003AF2321D